MENVTFLKSKSAKANKLQISFRILVICSITVMCNRGRDFLDTFGNI